MSTIGGNVTVKNAIRWDYCLEQCVESLVPVCDVINLVDSDSDDGTKDLLLSLAEKYPQVRLFNYPWPGVPGDRDCILRKLNWGRERLGTDFHLHLEADEVLGEESYDYIRNAATVPGKVLGMRRINFWLNEKNTLPSGFILSPLVIRFAPQKYYMGGDAPHELATQTEPAADWNAVHHCTIYHYGFLRKTTGYVGKYRDLMIGINGSEHDGMHTMELLENCAKDGKNWMASVGIPGIPYGGKHPEKIIPWLKERGYATDSE